MRRLLALTPAALLLTAALGCHHTGGGCGHGNGCGHGGYGHGGYGHGHTVPGCQHTAGICDCVPDLSANSCAPAQLAAYANAHAHAMKAEPIRAEPIKADPGKAEPIKAPKAEGK